MKNLKTEIYKLGVAEHEIPYCLFPGFEYYTTTRFRRILILKIKTYARTKARNLEKIQNDPLKKLPTLNNSDLLY